MPALPDVNKVLKIALTFDMDEDLGAKVGFFKRYAGVAPTSAQLNTFATAVSNLFDSANLDALMNDTYSLSDVDVIDLSSSTAAIGSDSTEQAGTRAGNVPPASACVVVSHRVARRYRGGHPRNYWPLGSDSDLADAQKWGDSFITDVNTAVDSFYGGINSLGWASAGTIDSVNISYYEGFTVFMGPTGRARNISTPRATPLIDTITAHSARHGVGSQRGRLLGLA